MSIPGMAASAVKKTIKDQQGKMQSIPDMLHSIFNQSMGSGDDVQSLTRLAKKTGVNSMVYIEDTLVEEDITVPLMSVLNELYISYVLVALNIYTSIDEHDVVSRSIGRIANESLELIEPIIDPVAAIKEGFAKASAEISVEAKRDGIDETVKHLICGRLIDFEFVVGSDQKGSPVTVTVPIFVQLRPVFMPSEVADAIVTLNFPGKLLRRWKMVKAGEIRFFRDFVLGLDLSAKEDKVIRKDRSNILAKFYNDKRKKQGKRFMSAVYGGKHNNLASSMIIFSKDTFEEALSNADLDWDDPLDRQQFFDESYSMVVVVVDQMYEVADIYYNGIPGVTNASFSAIKSTGGKNGGMDLTEVMKLIAKGAAPKF